MSAVNADNSRGKPVGKAPESAHEGAHSKASMSHADRLVLMANQIGTFFISQKSADAAAGIADHLQKFWEPRMRNAIIEIERAGGHGLQPEVRRAVGLLATSKSNPSASPAHGGS